MTREQFLKLAYVALAAIFLLILRSVRQSTRAQSTREQSTSRPDAGRAYEKQLFKELFGSKGENVAEFDFSGFPFKVMQTDGANALSDYERLKNAGEGFSVIVGNDDDVSHITDIWDDGRPPDATSILKRAEALGTDFDIGAMRKNQHADFIATMKAEGQEADISDVSLEPPDGGDWPADVAPITAPTVTSDVLSGEPLSRVFIATFPAQASYEIPAFVGWGGWNGNPAAEIHVAMLRKWNEKYGAELVGMTGDVLNLRVTTRPATRDEALALAREMYCYCPDIVEQGVGSVEALAALLMVSDYWYFWWD